MTHASRLERTKSEGPLEVWRMHLGTMPIALQDRPSLAAFLLALMHQSAGRYQLTAGVWLEATHIHLEGATKLIAPNARMWVPKTGFGIHPDGEVPRMWTTDDFSGAAFGSKLPVFNNQVFEISRAEGHTSAIEMMAGRGVLAIAMLSGSAAEFEQETTALLKPAVRERAFHAYSYFLPLLSAASAEHPQVVTWMATANMYIREVFEEEGLIILSRVPLEPCLAALGAKQAGQGAWSLDFGSMQR